MIDLHTHTTASDGTLTPSQLVRHAASIGLTAIAVTDHDTMEGVDEARKEGEKAGVRVVPGVEISLDFRGPKVNGRPGWMHLLVYFLGKDTPLAAELASLQQWRSERNQRMIRKLNELGLEITLAEVAAVSGGGQIGRPHFARVLTDKGHVPDVQAAFDRYLGKGAPAYEDKRRLAPDDAIARARADGAVPVLAHPCFMGLPDAELREKLVHYKSKGLAGIEVIYPDQDADYRRRMGNLVRDLDLVATGGTDFHGGNKPEIELGSGIDGNVVVGDSVLDQLLALVHGSS